MFSQPQHRSLCNSGEPLLVADVTNLGQGERHQPQPATLQILLAGDGHAMT